VIMNMRNQFEKMNRLPATACTNFSRMQMSG